MKFLTKKTYNTLVQAKESAESANVTLKGANATLQKELTQVKANLATSEKDCGNAIEKNIKFEKERDALKVTVADLTKQVADAKSTIEALESSQKIYRSERDGLKKQLKISEAKIAALEEVINLLNSPAPIECVLDMECGTCCETCETIEPIAEPIIEEVAEPIVEPTKPEPMPIINKPKKKKRK